MTELGDLLAAAGYSAGDLLPLWTPMDSGNSASTSSSSYTEVLRGAFEPHFIWDNLFQPDATTAVFISGDFDPSTDQIDFQVLNVTDNETALERTGITSTGIQTESGVYTPTTTTSGIRFLFRIRNNDNTTTVTVSDVTIGFGVEL